MTTGFLYYIFRPFTRITIAAYYRKLHIVNRDLIPMDGPMIISCNHPNSFAEPCILATVQPRTLHFLVRGDVFRQPLIAFLLRQTNQIPIYRIRDGFSSLKKNDQTFEACYKMLSKNAAILIFSEGNSLMEKRLRPIQKGTARLAFGAVEQYGMTDNFHILPVGINYTHADQFRSEVMVNFGNPIKIKDYLSLHTESAQQAINKLTQDIEAAMKPLILHINQPQNDDLYNDLMDLMDSEFPSPAWPVVENSQIRYNREQALVEWINALEKQEINELKKKLTALKSKLLNGNRSLRDLQYLKKPDVHTYTWIYAGALPAIPGAILNGIPYVLSKLISIPFLKSIEFYSPVRMGGLMIFALIQNTILIIYALSNHQWWLAVLAITAPFWGWITLIYREKLRALRKHRILNKNNKRSTIIPLREELLHTILSKIQ